ncbi:MAG: hypothetical protein DRJ59_08045 [Thermoprotei archaeon]|nr:MAG: hypothetical protein DRJ59_08045 [Thermoprotei archaeon]
MRKLKVGAYLEFTPVEKGYSPSAIMEDLESLGVSDLFLLTKDTKSWAYYPTEKMNARFGSEDFYGKLVREAKDRGIRVHAWFCLFQESLTDPSPVVKENPDIVVVNKYGKSAWEEPVWSYVDPKYSTLWICPSSKEYRKFLMELMEEVLTRYEVDGIHYDYVRYPEAIEGRYYCYCKRCLSKFKEEYGYELPSKDVIVLRYYVQILVENVTESVRELSELVHSYGGKTSAYVFTDYPTAIEAIYQDWVRFSRYLDFLLPTLYEVSPSFAERLIRNAVELTRKPIMPAVYANKVVRRAREGSRRWSTIRGVEYILRLVESVKRGGGEGIALFHYATLRGLTKYGLSEEDLEKLKHLSNL